jgi:hypothetical protein
MPAAPILATINLTEKAGRQQASRLLRSICSSQACRELLQPWNCDPADSGSLMIAAALQLVFQQGELYCVTGFPLSPPFSETRWLNAVLHLAPQTFADASGILTDRQVRTRWLRHIPMTITSAIAPAPPQVDWLTRLPDMAYDQGTVERIAALFDQAPL